MQVELVQRARLVFVPDVKVLIPSDCHTLLQTAPVQISAHGPLKPEGQCQMAPQCLRIGHFPDSLAAPSCTWISQTGIRAWHMQCVQCLTCSEYIWLNASKANSALIIPAASSSGLFLLLLVVPRAYDLVTDRYVLHLTPCALSLAGSYTLLPKGWCPKTSRTQQNEKIQAEGRFSADTDTATHF